MSQYETADFGDRSGDPPPNQLEAKPPTLRRSPTAPDQAVDAGRYQTVGRSNMLPSSVALDTSWHHYGRLISASNGGPDTAGGFSYTQENPWRKDQLGVPGPNGAASESSPAGHSSGPSAGQSDKNTLAGYLNPLHSSTDHEGLGGCSNEPTQRTLQDLGHANDKYSRQLVILAEEGSFQGRPRSGASSQALAGQHQSSSKLDPLPLLQPFNTSQESTRRVDDTLDHVADGDVGPEAFLMGQKSVGRPELVRGREVDAEYPEPPLRPSGPSDDDSLGYRASQEQAHFQKLIAQEMETKMQMLQATDQRHLQSLSPSAAFDASHPSHPYHKVNEELYEHQPALSPPTITSSGAVQQETVLVDSYRDPGNSIGVVNQVIVEDSQEDAYTGHTGHTPGTHKSSQMCSPAAGMVDLRTFAEFNADFNPLLSEMKSDIVHTEARLGKSANSRRSGRHPVHAVHASVNDQRRFEKMLEEVGHAEWRGAPEASQRSVDAQSQSYYLTNTELLGTKGTGPATRGPEMLEAHGQLLSSTAMASTPDKQSRASQMRTAHQDREQIPDEGVKQEDDEFDLGDIYRQTGEMKGLAGTGGHQQSSAASFSHGPGPVHEQHSTSVYYQLSQSSRPTRQGHEQSDHYEDHTPRANARTEKMHTPYSRPEILNKTSLGRDPAITRSNRANHDFGYNHAISDNCRDSLETNTFNTRFTQNTPELATSSNDGPAHRIQRQAEVLGRGTMGATSIATSIVERERPPMQQITAISAGTAGTNRKALQPLIQSNSPSTSNPQVTDRQTDGRSGKDSFKEISNNTQEFNLPLDRPRPLTILEVGSRGSNDLTVLRTTPGDDKAMTTQNESTEAVLALQAHSIVSSGTEQQRESRDLFVLRARGSEASAGMDQLTEVHEGGSKDRQLQATGDSRDAHSISNSRLRPVSEAPLEQSRPDPSSSACSKTGPRRTSQQANMPQEGWPGAQSPLAVDSKASEQACFSTFQMSSNNEYLAPLQIKDASRKGSGVSTVAEGQSLPDTRKASAREQNNVKLEERNRQLEKRLNDLEVQLRLSNQPAGAGVPQQPRESSNSQQQPGVPADTEASAAPVQSPAIIEESGASPTRPGGAEPAHSVQSPLQPPGPHTEQSQSMLIDGLTTQALHDRLGMSQITQHSKFSDTMVNKLLKTSEGPNGVRKVPEAVAASAEPKQGYFEDAKNFTLNELQTNGAERAACEEDPSHKYTFRQNENEPAQPAHAESVTGLDDQRREKGLPLRQEHGPNIFEYQQQANAPSVSSKHSINSAYNKDPQRTLKNITQASQIRHFVESFLSDDQGKRQKPIEASRSGEVASHTMAHEPVDQQQKSMEEVRVSSLDACSNGHSRVEEPLGADAGHGGVSRNVLINSKSSEGGVGAPTGVQKKPSVLELYQVEKVEDKANEVLSKSRRISRERQLQKLRHEQAQEMPQQMEIHNQSRAEYHQRQPESPLFQTTPQRDVGAPNPALASMQLLSKINSKYINSMPASTDREREAMVGENVRQMLMAYHQQSEHQEAKPNTERTVEDEEPAKLPSQTNPEDRNRELAQLRNRQQSSDPALSLLSSQLVPKDVRGERYFQSVVGTTRAGTLAPLHHNSANALPSTIFVNQQSSYEPLEERSAETDLPARHRILARGSSSLLPQASCHPPEPTQLSHSPSQGREGELKRTSAEPARESKDTYEYHSVVSQNNQLQVKLELLQAHCQKMEEERNKLVELNDLKVQEMESKLKLAEIQAARTTQRQAQQAEEERQHWRKREEDFREEVRTLLASQGAKLPAEQLVDKDRELNEKDKRIEELRHELEGLHTFYKEQISMIEKNYGDSTFNNVTRLENMQNQSQDFSQRGLEKKGGAIVGELSFEEPPKGHLMHEDRPGIVHDEHSESLEVVNQLAGQAPMPAPAGETRSRMQSQKRKLDLGTGASGLSLSPTQSHGASRHQSNGQMIHITNHSSHENLADSRLPHIENTGSHETQTFGGHHTSSEVRAYTGINHVLGSLLNGSVLEQIQRLDPHAQSLISSLQQHNAQLTDLLAAQSRQQALPSSSLSYGEKHRLLEHISQLEAIHQEVSTSLHRITVENQVLRKLRYVHLQDPVASDHLSKLLPKCLEDEVFLSWCRFVQILNRCIQKCFTRRPGAPKLPSTALNNTSALPVCSIDQDLLIQYIEKMVQSMQNIEKLVKKAPATGVLGHVEISNVKAQHLKVIETITESSLKLSQMPALQHQYVPPGNPQLEERVERGVQDVVNTIYFWRSTVQLHLDFMIQQYRNHYAHEYSQQYRAFEKEQHPKEDEEELSKAEDEDDFWSDFSDGDYRTDVEQRKDENDVLYNLQMWITSNAMEIDFMALFGQMAQREAEEGDGEGGPHSYLVGCQQFLTVLLSAGYEYCEGSLKQRTDLMSLVRAISCSQKQSILSMPKQNYWASGSAKSRQNLYNKTEPGYINYKQFLEDIKERPFKWWQNTLNGFLLEIQNEATDFAEDVAQDATPIKKSTKFKEVHQGGFFQPEYDQLQAYLPKPGTQFEKFCQKIVMNRLVDSKDALEPITESGKTHLTKASLRRFILKSQQQRDDGKLNLNRLDCHVLVKMLYQMNKEACRAEKDAERRQKLKNEVEKIAVSKLDHLVQTATQTEREDRYRLRCQQLELGTAARPTSRLLDFSLPSALDSLFYNNDFSQARF